jgi:oligopeptidase B
VVYTILVFRYVSFACIVKSLSSCHTQSFLSFCNIQYWEAAKYVATLRHAIQQQVQSPVDAPAPRTICLKCDMAAGHFSASDRYKYYKEKAFDYAFLLDQLGIVIV